MFYKEIRTKQYLSYISICSLSILYNSKFILMVTSLGTNAGVHCTTVYHFFGFYLSSENVTREDRFFSRCVDDYIIWTVCYDVRDLNFRRRKCSGPHFISVMIKQDPPTNFPWDKLMWELRTLVRDVRKLIFSYIGERKHITIVFVRFLTLSMHLYRPIYIPL